MRQGRIYYEEKPGKNFSAAFWQVRWREVLLIGTAGCKGGGKEEKEKEVGHGEDIWKKKFRSGGDPGNYGSHSTFRWKIGVLSPSLSVATLRARSLLWALLAVERLLLLRIWPALTMLPALWNMLGNIKKSTMYEMMN